MNDIYIFKDGKTIPAKIEQLFVTHGPYTIEGNRLDLLTKAQIVVDSSTSSISQVGTSSSTANTGSMLGRAVVGGVLTGGAGAVIGGLSGKRDSTIHTVSSESKNTELTTELTFEDGSNLYVLIKSMESFHWLLSFVNQASLTDEEIDAEKEKAKEQVKETEAIKMKAFEEKSVKKSRNDNNWLKNHYYSIFIIVLLPIVLFTIWSILIKEPKQQANLTLKNEITGIQQNKDQHISNKTKSNIASSTATPPSPISNADTLGSQWSYSQNEDKMSGGNTYHAVVLSSNTVDLKFPYNGSQNAKLHLRIANKSGKNLMFSLEKGQILCNSYDGCSVLVRFDNEKATNYSASPSADNSTEIIFINNYSKFVEKMIKAKRVLISANIYQQGAPVFEFDVSGFDKDKYKPKK